MPFVFLHPNYVSRIRDHEVRIYCGEKPARKLARQLGAWRIWFTKTWSIRYKDESELPLVLAKIRDKGFSFAGGGMGGSSPADILGYYMAEGMVDGTFVELMSDEQNPVKHVVSSKAPHF